MKYGMPSQFFIPHKFLNEALRTEFSVENIDSTHPIAHSGLVGSLRRWTTGHQRGFREIIVYFCVTGQGSKPRPRPRYCHLHLVAVSRSVNDNFFV